MRSVLGRKSSAMRGREGTLKSDANWRVPHRTFDHVPLKTNLNGKGSNERKRWLGEKIKSGGKKLAQHQSTSGGRKIHEKGVVVTHFNYLTSGLSSTEERLPVWIEGDVEKRGQRVVPSDERKLEKLCFPEIDSRTFERAQAPSYSKERRASHPEGPKQNERNVGDYCTNRPLDPVSTAQGRGKKVPGRRLVGKMESTEGGFLGSRYQARCGGDLARGGESYDERKKLSTDTPIIYLTGNGKYILQKGCLSFSSCR